MTEKPKLTIALLRREAAAFAVLETNHAEPALYGVTDGKAVGTYLEHKFRLLLRDKYDLLVGNSAKGIDFPDLDVDLKVTSIRQPQSSCPFRDARQKVYGLGYSLLILVYEKSDNPIAQVATLKMLHTIFVDKSRTADYQTTRGIAEIFARGGNRDDLVAYFQDRNLPVDEIGATLIAEEVLRSPPLQGYLTVSNALQWRLQYGRVIEVAGSVEGVQKEH